MLATGSDSRSRPFDIWRGAFTLAFVVTLIRISPIGGGDQEALWLILQFGPLLVAAAAALFQSPQRHFGLVGWALCGWAALVVLSAVWSVFPSNTLRQAGLLVLVFTFIAITVSTRWLDRRLLEGDLRFFFWLVSATAVAGFVLWLADSSGAMGFFGRYQGAFPNPNYAAITAALAVPLGAWIFVTDRRRWMRLGVVIAVVLLLATLVATGSRGPLGAMFVGLVCAAWFSPYRRKAIYFAAGFVVVAGAVLALFSSFFFGRGGFLDRTANGSDFTSGRLEIWLNLIDYWRLRPILGSGYRTVELLPNSDGFTAHNIYLSVLVELGVIGLLALVALFAILLVSGLRTTLPTDRMLFGVAATILLCELTEASLFGFGGPTAPLSWSALVAFAAFGRLGLGSRNRRRAVPIIADEEDGGVSEPSGEADGTEARA
jgi:O-antigen ligase